jgi:hypothetical protein
MRGRELPHAPAYVRQRTDSGAKRADNLNCRLRGPEISALRCFEKADIDEITCLFQAPAMTLPDAGAKTSMSWCR